MANRRRRTLDQGSSILVAWAILALAACTSRAPSMNQAQLANFGSRYAAAWSGQNPDSLAGFYSEGGSLKVNTAAPSIGRAAIRATAEGYMQAFPDMLVRMDSVVQTGTHATFHWTWTGTNTGPGGTGKAVHISGYELWTFGPDGLIAQSLGNFNEAEYQRQVTAGAPPTPDP